MDSQVTSNLAISVTVGGKVTSIYQEDIKLSGIPVISDTGVIMKIMAIHPPFTGVCSFSADNLDQGK